MASTGTPPGKIVSDDMVPAGGNWGAVVRGGHVLRIVDLEGKQGVDFLCYNAEDPLERYHAPNTIKKARTLALTKGHSFYSDIARPLMTMVGDTVGHHDTIGGCCSAPSNRMLYGAPNVPGCRENFLAVLSRFGLGRRDIVPNLNFFSNVPVRQGNALADLVFEDSLSKPGDHVDLRADMDVITAISNCPQVNNPASGGKPTAIRVIVWTPD
jgi:urea carboxylase-associated protein 1